MCLARLTSKNFNLIGNNSGVTIMPAQSSDQIGTPGSPINPLLGPLQNNGGPTLTRAILSGSPAQTKATPAAQPPINAASRALLTNP